MIRSFGLEARLAVLEGDGKGAVVSVGAAAITAKGSGGSGCVVTESEIKILTLVRAAKSAEAMSLRPERMIGT
jgi:hypothetical protein